MKITKAIVAAAMGLALSAAMSEASFVPYYPFSLSYGSIAPAPASGIDFYGGNGSSGNFKFNTPASGNQWVINYGAGNGYPAGAVYGSFGSTVFTYGNLSSQATLLGAYETAQITSGSGSFTMNDGAADGRQVSGTINWTDVYTLGSALGGLYGPPVSAGLTVKATITGVSSMGSITYNNSPALYEIAHGINETITLNFNPPQNMDLQGLISSSGPNTALYTGTISGTTHPLTAVPETSTVLAGAGGLACVLLGTLFGSRRSRVIRIREMTP